MGIAENPLKFFVSNKPHLAAVFGVSTTTIDVWIRNKAPRKTPRGYEIGAWIRWLRAWRGLGTEQAAEGDTEGNSAGGESKVEADRRKAIYRAGIDGLTYHKLKSDLISRNQYEQALNARSGWFVQVLSALPGQLAPLVGGKSASQAKAVMGEHCKALIRWAYGESSDG